MLNDIAFSQILQGIITSKESLLKDRLEGGLSIIRNDEFVTNDFENEDLIEPSDGIYDAQKKLDEWITNNPPPPGMDAAELKKKVWKQFADEMSIQISKQVTAWLKDDVMSELASAINNEIKKADITVTVPPSSVLVPTPTGPVPTITGSPIPPTNFTIT